MMDGWKVKTWDDHRTGIIVSVDGERWVQWDDGELIKPPPSKSPDDDDFDPSKEIMVIPPPEIAQELEGKLEQLIESKKKIDELQRELNDLNYLMN